jgi:CBS domain containing-hemolysin-like protein
MDAILAYASPWWLWSVAAAGVVLSALSNGTETGLYRLNRIRLRLRAESGDRRAKALQTLLADLRGMIIVCLVGSNVGAFIVTTVGTTLVASAGWVRSPAAIEVVAIAILAPFLFVFADLAPKSIFTAEADHWMYPLAAPLRGAYAALRAAGVIGALNGLSNLILRLAGKREADGADPFHPRQRLRAVLGESAAEGVISGYQHELVGRVLSLREQLVSRIMIPIGRVAGVPLAITRPQFVEELRRHSYSRLPVWEGSREHVVGIVHINDVLAVKGDSMDLPALMHRDFVVVPPEMTVGQAMLALRKARAAMAVVRDPRGRAVGIITIKDLVEEIVGELAAW